MTCLAPTKKYVPTNDAPARKGRFDQSNMTLQCHVRLIKYDIALTNNIVNFSRLFGFLLLQSIFCSK